MGTRMKTIDLEELLLANKRFRMGVAATWVMLALLAVGFLVAAKMPMRPLALAAVPASPLNVPLLRSLPQPEPKAKKLVFPAGTIARRR